MELKELEAEYGRLMLQSEMLNNRIMEIKRAIIQESQKMQQKNNPAVNIKNSDLKDSKVVVNSKGK